MESGYEIYFDWILKHFTDETYGNRWRKAKEIFFRETGRVDDGEQWYELRMNMFTEWYIWDMYHENGLTCSEEFLINKRNELTDHEYQIFLNLTVSQRILAQFIDWEQGGIWIKDLIRGGFWLIEQTMPMIGIKKYDIVDARIIYFEDKLYFCKSMLFHPRDAVPLIVDFISTSFKNNDTPEKILNKLAQMRLKYDRYRNIKINNIYKFGALV